MRASLMVRSQYAPPLTAIPRLVLVVGGLAARRVLGLTRLTDCIGGRYPLGDAVALPLPHPSGASGWLNDPANRERLQAALALVRKELASIP